MFKDNTKEKLSQFNFFIKKGLGFFLLYLGKYNRIFLKPLSPTPFDVSIKVIEKCNSRCITCCVWKEQLNKPELTFDDLEYLFYQLREAGIKTVGFYGGEPLLRKDIGKAIKRAKEIIRGAKALIITNGILLKDKAKELADGGIDVVCVSLDGIGEIDEQIRGIPGHYQRIIEGISELKKIDRANKIKINIGTTILPQNIHQVPRLVDLARKFGSSWSFSLFDTSPYHFRNVDDSSLRKIDGDVIKATIEYLYQAKKKFPQTLIIADPPELEFARRYLQGEKPFFNCILGYIRVYIDSALNVYSGCWALPAIGNLREERLRDILSSVRYRERVKEMYELKCPYCTCGHQINCMINCLPQTVKCIFKNIALYQKYF